MCLNRRTTYTRSYAVLSGAGTTYPSGAPEFTLCFSGVHWIVCPFSTYGF